MSRGDGSGERGARHGESVRTADKEAKSEVAMATSSVGEEVGG